MNQTLPKQVHVVGICGVATSALAIAFHQAGVNVTGSDKGFFPPVSTELERQGISFYAGWHPDKMTAHGDPDVVIVGTASGSQNPETEYARTKGIPLYSFAEAIGAFFVKPRSIVVSGTWGKTSSSALLSHILIKAGTNPSYMFGGISLSHAASAHLGSSDWSVFEGDEYKSSPTDTTAKFFYYHPTHLLLTAISWDHADLYPTEDSYFDAFNKLISRIPVSGFIVANKDNSGVHKVIDRVDKKIIWYGKHADYSYSEIVQNMHGISFTIHHGNDRFEIHSPMLGIFQAENITGCFAMACEMGIDPKIIVDAIASFDGMKRRLERRLDGTHTTTGVTVFDDIAHSPEKASSVLTNLRSIYPGQIVTVFEPNIGGRERASAAKYDHAFRDANIVIIPRLSKLKVAEDGTSAPMEGLELRDIIAKTHPHAQYIEDDVALVTYLTTHTKKDDCIVFLGSHGFRGMIEETIKKLP